MLFDPVILLREPLPVLATVLIIVVGKSLAAFAIVRAVRLSDVARAHDLGQPRADRRVLLHPRRARRQPRAAAGDGRDLILAGAIISILLNPVLFAALDWYLAEAQGRPQQSRPKPRAEHGRPRARSRPTELTDHVVLVGYGRVGTLRQRRPQAQSDAAAADRGNRAAVTGARGGASRRCRQCGRSRGDRGGQPARRACLFVAIPERSRAGRS